MITTENRSHIQSLFFYKTYSISKRIYCQ